MNLEDYIIERQTLFNKRKWKGRDKSSKKILWEDLNPDIQQMYLDLWAKEYENMELLDRTIGGQD